MTKKIAVVETTRCVSCGACVKECPMNAIEVWNGCYAIVDFEKCVGCGKCTKICPAGSLELFNREEVTI